MAETIEKKVFLWEIFRENFQNIFIAAAVALGLRKPPQSGDIGPGEKQFPEWLLRIFASITFEDEKEFNLIIDSHPEKKIRHVEAEFRRQLAIAGFDLVDYRLNLVGLRREFLERTKHPAPPDKSGGRLAFKKLTLQDSVSQFFWQLLDAQEKGNPSPEEVFERQLKVALDRMLVNKTSTGKKLVHWIGHNKGLTVLILLAIAVSLPCILYWTLYWILG